MKFGYTGVTRGALGLKDVSPVVTWIAGYRFLTQPRLSADFGQLPRNAYTNTNTNNLILDIINMVQF